MQWLTDSDSLMYEIKIEDAYVYVDSMQLEQLSANFGTEDFVWRLAII